ncbi:MAG: transpeptidase family protein [Spirochaetes bacterium]|nr:transpeptidase family protein [Spirochaetota bacterium]
MTSRQSRIRMLSILTVFGLLAVALLWRYGKLALEGTSGGAVIPRVVSIRGSIHDRNGRILAVDTDLYDVSLWKPAMRQSSLNEDIRQLAAILGIDALEIMGKLRDSSADFMYLKRRIDGETANSLRAAIEEYAIDGINIERISGRLYPEGDLAAQLIGFVGNENSGLAGAEASFEQDLRADPALAEAGFAYGNSVFLTIDADIQYRLEQLCSSVQEENLAEAVVMVAMEAKTGRVLSYVSLPDYDPNRFLEADRDSWLDRVSIYAFEPGSVFKVFSLASLLSLGGINEHSGFICDGSYEQEMNSGERIVIKCLGVHGRVDLTKILEYSCNAGAAAASETVSTMDFYARLRDFGFGERPGADRPSESSGLFAQPAQWSARTKPTVAMGQEILVTAMQMAAAATVLANDGMLLRPRTLEAVYSHDGSLLQTAPVIEVRQLMDAHDARIILDAMEAVTLDSGTGRRARIDDLRMSVKTGTAQMIDPETRRYSDTDFIASTLALFPTEDPEYIVYAAIIKPRGSSIYGGRIAAPLIREAALIIADLYGTPRGTTPVVSHSGTIRLPFAADITIGALMPDLTGVPKRLLTPLLLRDDLIVEIQGDGYVYSQDPAPGTEISAGMSVTLKLR